MAISYVGGQVGGRAGAASTTTVTYALTGGSNATPQAGDFVVVTMGVGAAARNPAQAVSAPGTWANLGQLNPNTQTYDTAMNVSYKFMPATPDTTLTAPSTGNAQDAQNWTIQVFRGVDPTNPWDVAAVAASAVGTGRPDPGSITPVTAGAWVVICGAGAAATGVAYVAPANFTTNFLTRTQADTNDAMIGSGYWTGWTSGAVNPAAYTGGTANAVDSWAAYTLALRPASSNVTLPLTGAQVAAQAGTVTKSNTGNVTLTGAQATASAGSVTASQANPNTPIRISTVLWQQDTLGTSGTPGAKAITVPADAQGVVVQVASTMAANPPSLSITSDFAGTFTVINSNDQDGCSIGYAEVTSTGSKNLTLAWTEGLIEGPSVYISFIKNINLQNWVRGTLAESTGITSATISTSISSGGTDLILVVDEQDGSHGIPAAMSGCSTLATTDGTYGSASRFQSVDNPSGSSTSLTGTGDWYATMTAVSIKQSGGDVNVVLTGEQATASAGTVAASQQVSKALTGEQATASAGTLGKQVSVALTGAQVAASAGTVTPSQALTRALTGAQVAASAGTLTASQQVTKALTGEQVSALAGTVTPSQSTGNVDVTLTGAQVAAQAGTVTPNQQVSKALTGAQVVASAGSVTTSQALSRALTGVQLAAQAGTLTASQQISKALTGAQVAASAGTLTASQALARALTGAQVTAQAGTVGVTQSSNDVTVALTGAQVAASAGTVTPSQAVTKALTGAQVAASAGSVTTSQAVSAALTGAQVAANAGSLTASQQVTKALTGVQVAAQAGTVGKQITVALTGAQVAASAGAVTTSQTSFQALTGAQVTAEAGTLTASQQKSVALTGAQVAAQAGTVGKQFELFRALTGAEVTAQAGALTSSQNITIALTGAQATAEAGALTSAQVLTRALTGAQVSVQAGSLTAKREFFATLFGSQITAQAGSLTTSQALTRALVGSQAQARAGIVDAGVSLSLFVNIPLKGARVVALAGQFANTTGQCGYNRGRVVNE